MRRPAPPLWSDLQDVLRALEGLVRKLGSMASALASDVSALVSERLREYRERRPPPRPPDEPTEPDAPTPPPREPLKAPPSTSELPVLRFAKVEETKQEEEDLYDGEIEDEGFAPSASLWVKRIVVFTILGAVAVFAALNWQTLLPKATQLGQSAFTEVGKYLGSRDQAQRLERAVQGATEQLPYLAPETIQLVLSGSSTGTLDPPDVFYAARQAADRGRSALTSQEAQELDALQRVLLNQLTPVERERVREYDRLRANRVPFLFENQNALDLFARGARALPPESRGRLQALLGKAIGAGLPAAKR